MAWDKLSPAELQAVRSGLHLSVKEASEWIAGHSTPRTWQKYEKGDAPIPDDIDLEMYGLSQIAEKLFDELHEQAFQHSESGETLTLRFYRSEAPGEVSRQWIADNGPENPVNWRIHQSVVSRIFREFGSVVTLI